MSSNAILARRLLLEETVPGGGMWSLALRRHQALRLTDLEGGANVSLLLFNRDQMLERYNMPDTLKAQHTAFLTKGRVLYSDMGRILCSITEDDCGWHDTLAGLGDAELARAKYGVKRYQEQRNACYRNARDQLLTELSKWGLGVRDLVPNLNLFSKVVADEDGRVQYIVGHSQPGSSIDLRAEMNVLVVLTTCQHPLDPNPLYAPKPVKLEVYQASPPAADDACRRSRPENERGFANTERLFLGHLGANAGAEGVS
jgi:urea carboxylase-associated protein 2